jgi:hypothetical protein
VDCFLEPPTGFYDFWIQAVASEAKRSLQAAASEVKGLEF